jgi:hypothetical protein
LAPIQLAFIREGKTLSDAATVADCLINALRSLFIPVSFDFKALKEIAGMKISMLPELFLSKLFSFIFCLKNQSEYTDLLVFNNYSFV